MPKREGEIPRTSGGCRRVPIDEAARPTTAEDGVPGRKIVMANDLRVGGERRKALDRGSSAPFGRRYECHRRVVEAANQTCNGHEHVVAPDPRRRPSCRNLALEVLHDMKPFRIRAEGTRGAVKPHRVEVPEKQIEKPTRRMARSNHPITDPTDICLEAALKRYALTARHERILAPACRREVFNPRDGAKPADSAGSQKYASTSDPAARHHETALHRAGPTPGRDAIPAIQISAHRQVPPPGPPERALPATTEGAEPP